MLFSIGGSGKIGELITVSYFNVAHYTHLAGFLFVKVDI